MQNNQRSFTADRRTFSSNERKLIGDYVSFLSKVWSQPLTKASGMTDEGESWVVTSQDSFEGVKTLNSISIEIINGKKSYRYFCSPRQLDFIGDTLIEVIEAQSPDGTFKQFTLHHNTTPDTGDSANVIQFISAS